MIVQANNAPTWETRNRGKLPPAAIDAMARLLIDLDEKMLRREAEARQEKRRGVKT